VASKETAARHLTVVPSREFLDRYTVPVQSFGECGAADVEIARSGRGAAEQAYAGPGRHDDLDPAVHFEGRWARFVDQPKAYRGTFVHTNDLRSRVEIRFEGRAIRLVYAAAANRCKSTASFSYAVPIDFDEYAARTQWQAVSQRFEAPTPGKNTLIMKIDGGDKALNSYAACHLDLDGFIVE